MKKMVILAMHGAPPNDFPLNEKTEMFDLHNQLEHDGGNITMVSRYTELEKKMRCWPRTDDNDPFYTASQELAQALSKEIELTVLTGFNEFCAPSLEETLELAAANGADSLIVVTTMMTRGGEHAEVDIARVVASFQRKHPGIKTTYAWPFKTTEVAHFLAAHIAKFAKIGETSK
jgi:sirohydrochlorin cobaltochelatase